MKNIFIAMILLFCGHISFAQTNPATTLANKIAQKMKDTLDLSDIQKSQIYNLNLQLHDEKMSMRQQFAGSPVLREKIQTVENKRDSLYMSVLTEPQFSLYRQKKRMLVNNH